VFPITKSAAHHVLQNQHFGKPVFMECADYQFVPRRRGLLWEHRGMQLPQMKRDKNTNEMHSTKGDSGF